LAAARRSFDLVAERKMTVLEQMLEGLPTGSVKPEDVRVGPFLTAVEVGGTRLYGSGHIGRCGLASTLAEHRPAEPHGVRGVGRLTDLDAVELARYLLSRRTVEASMGMATLNALLDVPSRCFEEMSVRALLLQKGEGKRVAVVGHFPFVNVLREAVAELHVLELKPVEGDLPVSRMKEVLPRCDVIALTATVLMNGTYAEVLPLCREAFTVMLGPSTPPSPVLFDHGIDALAGSLVTDPQGTLLAVSQGATYRDLKGVSKWTWIK